MWRVVRYRMLLVWMMSTTELKIAQMHWMLLVLLKLVIEQAMGEIAVTMSKLVV